MARQVDRSFHASRREGTGLASILAAALIVGGFGGRASAETTLIVDLAAPIRPVTHAASGSLYGVTEKLPMDVNALIGPLKPNMLINPAADVQQPVGDAIVVAGRVAPIGTRVTIRLADWFPRWPYAFTDMNDWFSKLAQTVSRKQASGVDNYYGYEIWNEPDGTWKSSLPFNDFWKQTHAKLRELDKTAKTIGPSISWYNVNYLRSFLSFAKANNCLPDIVAWHELSGSDLSANFKSYRALEKELGIGPLPISINEYSGKGKIDDEGKPGASAPMIAKFERFEIDSACISYWDVPHPGRLGSLLASDTSKNGGWWFYKWYGDMSGKMVTTVPPASNDAAALDGFANLDAVERRASALFGGANDGTIKVVVKGFASATYFGSKVHAVVERTPFANRTTPVNATEMLSEADVSVVNDQIAITVSRANGSDGYRVRLSPVNDGAPPDPGGGRGDAGAAASDGGAADGGAADGGPGSASGGTTSAGDASGGTPDGNAHAADAGATRPGAGLLDAGATEGSNGARIDAGAGGNPSGAGRGASPAAGDPDAADGSDDGCSLRSGQKRGGAWLLLLLGALGRVMHRRKRLG